MSLLAGLSQQGDSIAAHNGDAAAHGLVVLNGLTISAAQTYIPTFSAAWRYVLPVTVSPGSYSATLAVSTALPLPAAELEIVLDLPAVVGVSVSITDGVTVLCVIQSAWFSGPNVVKLRRNSANTAWALIDGSWPALSVRDRLNWKRALAGRDIPLNAGWAQTTSGTGASIAYGALYMDVRSTTAGAIAARITGCAIQRGSQLWNTSARKRGAINWSRPIGIRCGFWIQALGGTAGRLRIMIGKDDDSYSIGQLARKGFGLEIVQDYSTRMMHHDGSTLVNTALGVSLANQRMEEVTIISDGAGNITYEINGVIVASAAGGPTGDDNTSVTISIEADRNGAAEDNRIMPHWLEVFAP